MLKRFSLLLTILVCLWAEATTALAVPRLPPGEQKLELYTNWLHQFAGGWECELYAAHGTLQNCTKEYHPDTIWRWGCALTSLTMLYNYYGMQYMPDPEAGFFPKKISLPSGPFVFERLHPGKLDDWLVTFNGYAQRGNVDWDSAIKSFYYYGWPWPDYYTYLHRNYYCSEDEEPSNSSKNLACYLVDWIDPNRRPDLPTAQDLLDNDLEHNRPDMMKITRPVRGEWRKHFVLVAGYDAVNASYTVYDPGKWYGGGNYYRPVPLDSLYSQYTFLRLYRFFGWNGKRSPKISEIRIRAYSPVEMEVIDPQSRRTGYDAATGKRQQEDPMSLYYEEESPGSLDGDEAASEPVKMLTVVEPQAGNYVFRVVGTGAGPYTIDVELTSSDGTPNLKTALSGTATPDMRETYRITYSPTGEASLSQTNQAPVANAGSAQTGEVSYEITLDGSGSGDPDGDPMQYTWSLVSKPEGSASSLSNVHSVKSVFIPDLPGTYTFQLTVNDYFTDSASSTVTITATPLKSQLAVTPNFSSGLSAGVGSISFDVNNIGRIGVSSGIIEMSLTDPDGAVVSTGSRTFGIGVGQATTVSIPVAIPSLKFGNYTLTYAQSDETRTGSPTTITVLNSVAVSFQFDKVTYRVRETANLVLDLMNSGKFDMGNVSVVVSAPDANYTNSQSVSIGLGQALSLKYAVPIPATILAGPHTVNVSLSLQSESQTGHSSKLEIRAPQIAIDNVWPTTLTAGETVNLLIENTGGADTAFSAEKLIISDANGVAIYHGNASGSIMAGERKTISFQLPSQSAIGIAFLDVQLKDGNNGSTTKLVRTLEITGRPATLLETRTDKDIYLSTEGTTGLASIFAGDNGIDAGSLKVSVVRTRVAGPQQFTHFFPTSGWCPVNQAYGIATARDGSFYVADLWSNAIVKCDSNGNLIATLGGYGTGDGQFNRPNGVALGPDGSIYVADTSNNRIQKFDSNGEFITKWGSSGSAPSQFNRPYYLAVGPDGSVYVADTFNNRIQKFDDSGNFVTAWNFNYGLRNPMGVAVATDGSVYVADAGNNRIRKSDGNGTHLATFGSSGSGDGQFNYPIDVAVASGGWVYVADGNNNRIQKFTGNGSFIAKWGGNGNEYGQFKMPWGVAVASDGRVYVADTYNHRIQKFDDAGIFIAAFGIASGDDGRFSGPNGLSVGSDGSLFVTDTSNNRIQRFDSKGNFVAKWGTSGSRDGQLNYPRGAAVGPDGSVYVADTGNHRIQKFDSIGNFIMQWGTYGSGGGQFIYPYGIAVGPEGTVYVADSSNSRIQKFDNNGNLISIWYGSNQGSFYSPQGVAVGQDGSVYVEDTGNHSIQKFDKGGNFITKWGTYGSGDGQFDTPQGIAADSEGFVYVTDTKNCRIQKFDSNGAFVAAWGSRCDSMAQFKYPLGIAVSADGTVYVADTQNSRIVRLNPSFTGSEVLFEATRPVTQVPDETHEYTTDIGVLNVTGKLYLQAELKNSLGQMLANAVSSFYIIDGNTALLFSTDKRVYRPGEAVTITGEVRNLAAIEATDLALRLMQQASGGQAGTIYAETMSISAGDSHAFTVTTTADSESVVTLTGTVEQNNSTLIEIADQYEVTIPKVTATVSASDVVGNEQFSMNVDLKNEGKVDVSVSMQYAVGGSQGNTIDNQAVTIPAGEKRLLQYAGQITQTTTYAFAFTGDLSQTIMKTVVYGLGAKIDFGMQSAETGVFPEGRVSLPVTITNTGQLDETLAVAYDLSQGSGSQGHETRSYFLPKGGSITDTLSYDLTAGSYQVSAVSSQPNATAQMSFSVLKENVVTMTTVAGSQGQDGLIPVTMSVSNSGYNEINGSTQLAVISNEGKVLWRGQTQVSGLKSQFSSSVVINVDSSGLVPGAYPVSVVLFDAAGRQLAENQARIRTEGPIFEITSLPNNPTFTAGRDASLAFAVKNTGTAAGAMRFGAKVMDVLNSSVEDVLQPGQEKPFAFSFAVPEDTEEKDYSADYVLSSASSQGTRGAAAFHIAQVKVGVTAVLDKDGYTNGETAALAMTITKQSSTEDGTYVAIIRYGTHHDMQLFTLSSQPSTVTFNVPLTEITGERLFYGVHFRSGRAVYQGSLAINEARPDLASTFSGQLPDGDAFVPEVKRDTTVEIMTVSSNYGKTASGATTIALYDGDSLIGTKAVPGIDPGAKENVSFVWNVLGKGGDRVLKAVIDPQDSVLEYSEANNTGVMTVRVPDITIFTDTDKDSYKIRQKTYITSTLTNLTADKTYSNLLLLTSAKDSSGKEVYAKSIALGALQPTASTASTEAWSTSGLAADGSYTITQRVFAGSDLMAQSSKQVTLEKAPDFTVTVDVDARKMKQGEQATFAASIEPFSGWGHDVAFSMDGLPSGAAATFSPESLAPPAKTEAIVTTTDATPAGSYTLYLTAYGTDEGEIVSHTVPLTLDVSAFGLETATPSMAVKQLETALFPITVMSKNSYEGSISLSVTGLPNGVHGSFDTATAQAPGAATLSILTSKYVRPGTYTLTVTGDDGLVRHTLNLSLVLQPNPAIAPAIITTPGPGPQNLAWVRLFDGAAQLTKEFTAFASLYGARAVSADLDGDGYDEIVVAQGADPKNTGTLRAFRRDGSFLAEYTAFNDRYGLVLAAADTDGDWVDEIIVGTGPDPQNPGVVKVLKYTGTGFSTVTAWTAHSPTAYGLNVAAGDVDGDNLPEIITTPGPGTNNLATVTIWKYTGTAVSEMATFTTFEGTYGVNIAAGDIDGDGRDEIVAGTGPDPKNRALIRVYDPTGVLIKELLPYDADYTYGVTVAAADMDGDGRSEIIGGLGRGPQNDALVTILDANGNTLRSFLAYPAFQDYGVNVSVGRAGR